MKNLKIIITLTVLAFSSFITACSESTINNPAELNSNEFSLSDINNTISNSPYDNPTVEQAIGLQFMREEEKLARDVYKELYAKFPLRPFLNISQSEQTHTDAIKSLLTKYNIEDPVSLDVPGIFKNSDLQELYTKLILAGGVSEVEALKVGAAIEEIDILDLEKHLTELVNNEDIKIVYNSLKNASGNHLKAFVRNLSARGINYTPLYLDQDSYLKIIQ